VKSESEATLTAMLAMLDQLDGPALSELERALRGKLAAAQETPAERRGRRLGFLAELIRLTGAARPPRTQYDALRPPTAPSGQELVDEFGSWRKVCRAAAGVLPDGRINRTGGTNHPRTPGERQKTEAYTRDEIATAIRRCAYALGRKPTSGSYEQWREREIRKAKRHGQPRPRIPSLETVRRQFDTWRAALAAAAIDERALEQARERRQARTDRKPPKITASELASAGADHLLRRTGEIDFERISAPPLGEALELARILDCSLEYLLGAGERGRAPMAPGSRTNNGRGS
jgi:hypothetical protein